MEQTRETKEFYAFISYKREDERWARWLQHRLEHYRLPANLNGRTDLPKEIRPIFRDTSELLPGNLPQQINDALAASRHLIVICSPHSAQSVWVNKEIETFIALGKQANIIPFIVDGHPFAQNPDEECFPVAIRNLPTEQELLGANVAEMGREAAAVKTVARMFGIRFDTLWGRYQREQKRRRNWIIAAVAVFVLAILGVAAYIWQQNNSLKESVSKAMAKDAEILTEKGDSYLARKVAVAALDFAYTFEAESALRHAWERNNAVLKGHTGKIHSTTFSPDGKLIASASEDNTIRIWDIATGRCLLTIMDSIQPWYIVFSPDGNSIMASLIGGRTIHIWDVRTGQCQKTMEHKGGHATFNPDGRLIATIKGDTIFIWNAETGQCIQTMAGHMDEIKSISFSLDGERVISASLDRTVRIWDVKTGKCLRTMMSEGSFEFASFISDGEKIVTLSPGYYAYENIDSKGNFIFGQKPTMDRGVRIWDVGTGKCIRVINDKWLLGVTADGKRIILRENNAINIMDVEIGWPYVYYTTLNIPEENYALNTSPDGYILAAADGNNVCLRRFMGESCEHSLLGHTKEVNTVSYSPDGNRLVSASEDKTIRIWDAQTGRCLNILKGHNNEVNSAEFSPDGRYIVSSSKDTTVRIWDAVTGQCLKSFDTIFSKQSSVSFSPDGRFIVGSGVNKSIHFLDIATGKIIWTMKGNSSRLFDAVVVFSPDGDHIAIGTDTIRIIDIKTRKCIQELKGHLDMVTSITISPNGKLIASSSQDETIRIWDVETGECLRILSGKKISQGGSVVFSPDCRLLAVKSSEVACVYDVSTGLCLWTFGQGWSDEIAFSPDGRHLAIPGDRNGALEIYDFPPLDELIQKTRAQFKDNPLTPEERRQYYLE